RPVQGTALEDSPLRGSPAFNQFNHELNCLEDLLVEREPPPFIPDAGGRVEETAASRRRPWNEEAHARVLPRLMESFVTALKQEAAKGALVIALDPVRVASNHFQSFLLPMLIGPVAEGTLANIRIVLVLRKQDEKVYLLGNWK